MLVHLLFYWGGEVISSARTAGDGPRSLLLMIRSISQNMSLPATLDAQDIPQHDGAIRSSGSGSKFDENRRSGRHSV